MTTEKQKVANKRYYDKLKINKECEKNGQPPKYIFKKRKQTETINVEIVDTGSVVIGLDKGELKTI